MKFIIKESSIRDTRNDRYFKIISEELSKMVNVTWYHVTQPGNYAILTSDDFTTSNFLFGVDVKKINDFTDLIGFRYENFSAKLIIE